jgi:uncharacterized protein (DUF983 family)
MSMNERRTRDSGGWASAGVEATCPKCGEYGKMIETIIYGRKTLRHWEPTHVCNVCAHGFRWFEDDDRD